MSTQFDRLTEDSKYKRGFTQVLLRKSIVVAAASLDPLAVSPTSVIPRGTPMAPVPATGLYKPVRMTLADAACTTGETVIGVTDTTMFAVGDVVTVKALATPTAAAAAAGTIESISAGVSITLAANSTTAVAIGDIIQVAENDLKADAVILEEDIDLRGADGTAVDTVANGVIAGAIDKSACNFNTAKGITFTRLAYMCPLIYFANVKAGTLEVP